MAEKVQNINGGGSSEDKEKPLASSRSRVSYPYFNLNDSVDVAIKIHENGGGTCSPDQLAAFLDYKSIKSGTYQTRVSAAKQFGFVRTDGGNLVVTDRARHIISPVMPDDAINAKADAFLSVELFKEIFEKYKGGSIPPEVGLRNLLLQTYSFSPDRVGPAIRVLLESAEQAGFFNASGDKTRLIRPAVKPAAGAPMHPSAENLPAPPEDRKTNSSGGGNGPAGVHSAIIGLLRELPQAGVVWPKKQKERFVKAFQATLDFIYPSDDEEKIDNKD